MERDLDTGTSSPATGLQPGNFFGDRKAVFEGIAEKVRRLVANGEVAEARTMLSEVPFGCCEQLDKWRRLLAEPVVKRQGVATGKNSRADILWIREKASQYKGQWVAIRDGQLLGHNKSRLILHTELKQSDNLNGATFFRVQE